MNLKTQTREIRQMDLTEIYGQCVDGGEGDIIIFLSKDEMLERSRQFPDHRYNIYLKTPTGGYRITYEYVYQNGERVKW